MKSKKVLVTTEFRGVFYGDIVDDSRLPEQITLKNVKNCIRWSADCRGFLGLAAEGPTGNCSIGAEVPEMKLYKITSVTPVTANAIKNWDKS